MPVRGKIEEEILALVSRRNQEGCYFLFNIDYSRAMILTNTGTTESADFKFVSYYITSHYWEIK